MIRVAPVKPVTPANRTDSDRPTPNIRISARIASHGFRACPGRQMACPGEGQSKTQRKKEILVIINHDRTIMKSPQSLTAGPIRPDRAAWRSQEEEQIRNLLQKKKKRKKLAGPWLQKDEDTQAPGNPRGGRSQCAAKIQEGRRRRLSGGE
eukprot:TRINITY_DN2726_c0_g1_i9.p3 TRINITY_DN2726_c0_g1~~TRINITY_DN2726_c0_g1_i9.p3  ORF type:complete len:151 (-),score=23.74 TRINITY_DN2726_c0_g1_i9:727-1179(-)